MHHTAAGIKITSSAFDEGENVPSQYELDQQLTLPARTTKGDLEKAMKGHILSYGEIMGRYARK